MKPRNDPHQLKQLMSLKQNGKMDELIRSQNKYALLVFIYLIARKTSDYK